MSFLSDTSYEIGHFDLQDILSLIQKSTYGQPHRDAPGNSCIPAVNPYMAAFPYILQVKLIITTGKAVRFERSPTFSAVPENLDVVLTGRSVQDTRLSITVLPGNTRTPAVKVSFQGPGRLMSVFYKA